MAKEVLIIGAGITGALTASLLSRARPSLSLTVWDKARGAGGRMSTHRDPSDRALHVDMGAQYISRFAPRPTDDAAFTALKEEVYAELLKHGVLKPLSGTIAGERNFEQLDAKFVAQKGMNSVAKYFLEESKAAFHYQQQLKTIQVEDQRISCETSNGGVVARNTFNGVILTMPVPQILSLDGNLLDQLDPAIRANLQAVKYSCRYALGLTYNNISVTPGGNDQDWSMKYTDHPVIRFLSWDTSKRTHESGVSGQTLLVHTGVPFAKEHLETEKKDVEGLIMTALDEVIPGLPRPSHSHLIRWRYSQVLTPYSECPGFIQLSSKPLVLAAGDGFVGSNFENCLRSAQLTTQHFLSHF